jgi:hypothetical protein
MATVTRGERLRATVTTRVRGRWDAGEGGCWGRQCREEGEWEGRGIVQIILYIGFD